MVPVLLDMEVADVVGAAVGREEQGTSFAVVQFRPDWALTLDE